MPLYSAITTAADLSQLVALLAAQDEAIRSLERGATAPGAATAGALWNRTDHGYAGGAGDAVYRSNGTSYSFLLDPRHAQLNAGGTVSLTGPLNFGGQKGTNAADGTSPTDLATVGQVAALASAWTGDVDGGGHELRNLGAPAASDQSAARVDDTWQTTHGIGRRFAAFDVDDGSGVVNACAGGKNPGAVGLGTFCPAIVHLVIEGNVTAISGGAAVLNAVPRTQVACVRDGDEGTGWRTYATLTGSLPGGGANTVDVQVRWKTDAPRGFLVRLRRQSDGAACTVVKRVALAQAAVGFVS